MLCWRRSTCDAWDDFAKSVLEMKDEIRSLDALCRDFYNEDARPVAVKLLGKLLLRDLEGRLCGGIIVETEAYLSTCDPANHSYRGLNRRNRSMFGPPGHAYVYRIHQQHCLNVVTEPKGVPSAVLIRAIQPIWGVELMLANRGKGDVAGLTDGPGKVCQALAIDLRHDGLDLTCKTELWIAELPSNIVLPSFYVGISERVGVTAAKDLLLRYFIFGNAFVSQPRKPRLLMSQGEALSWVRNKLRC
ncbi:MAG: hypothetical protein HZRFUVUK_001416 [Candidatus Fervidibacterota bacterium]|jgi:DNA-3-methyladenine glycosylase